MSQNILPVDLSSKTVGNSGDVQLPTVTSNKGYTLLLFNESGSGLSIQFLGSKDNHILPAGAWRKYVPNPGEEAFTWTVLYILPGAPVTQLFGTLYMPGEAVPDTGVLGNSPIGIGGTVATSSVQTLSNEGNAANTEIIDIGTSTLAKLIDIFNDHFIWSVQQAGVAHQVLKGLTSGNPLQIGQAGDITEVLGDLLVDGHLIEPNNIAYRSKDSGGVSRDIMALDTSDNLILHTGKSSGQFHVKQLGGAELIIIDNNGITIDGGNIVSNGLGALTAKGLTVSTDSLNLILGSLTRISFFDASVTTVSSNFAHGLGAVPDLVLGINEGTNSTANPLKWSKANSDINNAALVSTINGTFHCVAIKF